MTDTPEWVATKGTMVGSKMQFYNEGTIIRGRRPERPDGLPNPDFAPVNGAARELAPSFGKSEVPHRIRMPYAGLRQTISHPNGSVSATYVESYARSSQATDDTRFLYEYEGREPGFAGGDMRRWKEKFWSDCPIDHPDCRPVNDFAKQAAA